MNQQEFQLKKIGLIVKGLFATAALLGVLLFGSAALIYSASPATAAGPNTGYGSGKYQMSMQAAMDDKNMNWYILVWDTETGQSKLYYGTSEIKKITAASSSYQLPSSPL